MLGPPFPRSSGELTADFLSAALGVECVEISVRRIGADRGMLGEVVAVDLIDDTGRTVRRVAAKFAARRESALASARRGRTHERELRFYDELLPTTPVSVPAPALCCYDPDTAEFLLVQDVIDVDAGVDQVDGIGVERVRAVITEIARLHARWWRDPDLVGLDWLPDLRAGTRRRNLAALIGAGWEPLCVSADLDEVDADLGGDLERRLLDAFDELADLPSTLVHCDLRADNLLFDARDGGVSIIDWQGVGVGPPSFDLAYLVSQCLTVDDRRRHESELLDHYRRELAQAGVDTVADDVLEGYGSSMFFGLAVACAVPVVGDPAEPRVRALAAVMAHRAIAALRDHGQIPARTPS